MATKKKGGSKRSAGKGSARRGGAKRGGGRGRAGPLHPDLQVGGARVQPDAVGEHPPRAMLAAAGVGAVAARFGAAAVAAHQVVLQLWNFLALVLDSLAIAAR